VKSAKISLTLKSTNEPAVSNGYGFVCFQLEEALEKAIAAKTLNEAEIFRYQPRDPREIRKVFNNIFIKNFSPAWNDAKLKEVFGRFGEISCAKIITAADQRRIAFVCYGKNDDKAYGPQCA
jgi:polyadenylate-binding protein